MSEFNDIAVIGFFIGLEIFLLASGFGKLEGDLEAKINTHSNGAVYTLCMT